MCRVVVLLGIGVGIGPRQRRRLVLRRRRSQQRLLLVLHGGFGRHSARCARSECATQRLRRSTAERVVFGERWSRHGAPHPFVCSFLCSSRRAQKSSREQGDGWARRFIFGNFLKILPNKITYAPSPCFPLIRTHVDCRALIFFSVFLLLHNSPNPSSPLLLSPTLPTLLLPLFLHFSHHR